ncbi:histidine phosphatase family protein [Clostridium lacusfryxellense]|uniref:histidine phosphatase family protein n=1 Tax=Clostridium lacusfryxellense TaxID=205328 RepID=UPI0028B112EA|nr:histidine phosphatase family protein [Clostridium lacusfryxellense]
MGTTKWDKCFSSDISRAVNTSTSIFKGEIIKTHLLREVPISPVFNTNLKLPYIFWCISGRLAWLFHSKSQIENKKDTQKRVNEFLDSINDASNNNILIVSHGFFMNTLQKELNRRDVTGQDVKRPRNGTLYLYEK